MVQQHREVSSWRNRGRRDVPDDIGNRMPGWREGDTGFRGNPGRGRSAEDLDEGPRNGPEIEMNKVIWIERPITGVIADQHGILRYTYDRNFGAGRRVFPDGSGPADIVASRPCIVNGKIHGRLYVKAIVGKNGTHAWPQDKFNSEAKIGIPVKGDICMTRDEARKKCIMAQAVAGLAITMKEVVENGQASENGVTVPDADLTKYAVHFYEEDAITQETFDEALADTVDAFAEFARDERPEPQGGNAWERMGG